MKGIVPLGSNHNNAIHNPRHPLGLPFQPDPPIPNWGSPGKAQGLGPGNSLAGFFPLWILLCIPACLTVPAPGLGLTRRSNSSPCCTSRG